MPTQISASNQPLTLIEVRLHDDMMPKEICSNRRFVGFDESTTITSFKTSKHLEVVGCTFDVKDISSMREQHN
jgi:hypothetical protein